MPNTKPTKKELARFRIMDDCGFTANAIGKKTERDPKTIRKYLADLKVYKDPIIKELIEKIRETEVSDLFLLGAKARRNLHTLLDGGKMGPIENVATMDRAFQQRRLLEGRSTENIGMLSRIIERAHERPALKKEEKEIESEDSRTK